jgi:endonuclease/exonuclease/phosphatase family metal-dependent hydrolase
MPEPLCIASYNTEWFTNLFDDHDRPLPDAAPSSRYKVTRAGQLDALGIVFTALDADAILVVEAPDSNRRRSSVRALERFAAGIGLRARKAVTGFPSETEQEITLLYDPDRLTARHDPRGSWPMLPGIPGTPRFDGVYRVAIAPGELVEPIRHSKPPLEVALTTPAGAHLRLIGVHVKSKAPHGAHGPADLARVATENRRKQLAQCLWVRARVEEHLASGDALIVLGDFNDGPGIDDYEAILGRSGVEVVMGAGTPGPQLYDPHAVMALATRVGIIPTSARFYLAPAQRYFEAMLDFIMVSPDLAARRPAWRIWHPFNDPGCAKIPELRDALLAASDHFPVTLDVLL